MKGRKEEAEVIVRLDQQDQCVYICVASWPAMYRKMNKMYGQSLDKQQGGQSARWKLRLKVISFRKISSLKGRARNSVLVPERRTGGQFGANPYVNGAE